MNKVRIGIENLSLELTRKCNLQCAHCLRGGCENKEMSDETIDRIFEEVSAIGLLHFIGGESSLATGRITHLIESAKAHNTLIHNILVFTNATIVTDEYIETLKKLRRLADNDYNNYVGFTPRYEREGKYPLKIIVSLDKFHLESIEKLKISKETIKANIEKLAQFFPVEIDKICNYVIYNEGNGVNLQNIYKVPTPTQKYCYWHRDFDNLFLIGPMVAIQYDGKLIEVNRSYTYNDKHGIGNINTENLMSMFKKLKKEQGIKKCKDIQSVYECMNKYLHVYSSSTNELQSMMNYYKKHNQKIDYSYFEERFPSMAELTEQPSESTSAPEF